MFPPRPLINTEDPLPTHLGLMRPDVRPVAERLLSALTMLEVRLANFEATRITELSNMIKEARDSLQRDVNEAEALRALMAEADRSIRENAAAIQLAISLLQAFSAVLTILRRANTPDEFVVPEGITMNEMLELEADARERLANFEKLWPRRDTQPEFRFVTAVGATLEQMRANLAATEEGETLIKLGDTRLIWVNEADLWSLCFRHVAFKSVRAKPEGGES